MTLLQGKAAAVSGAGAGIGRAHALLLAAHGAAVVVNDIDAERAQQVVAFVAALLTVAYIVSVAINRSPTAGLG